ncbi:hypothetical protein Ancab_015154 [Ancistrocladus abbreviatus]
MLKIASMLLVDTGPLGLWVEPFCLRSASEVSPSLCDGGRERRSQTERPPPIILGGYMQKFREDKAFCPSYGSGWKLQTVVESEGLMKFPGIQRLKPSLSSGSVSQPVISFIYIAKILLAFIFIILLAAVFTLALENLPRLISSIKSSS